MAWTERSRAYTARQPVASSAAIHAGASYDIALGQTLDVQQPAGTGTVVHGGVRGAISIENQTTTPLTCGIAVTQGAGAGAPLCAFPLFGKNLQILVPLRRVLLMFSTVPIAPGTAIERAYGPGILVEMEGADERAITFEIDAGWSWGGSAWAQQVPASADIVPLLVVPSTVAP